MPVPAQRPRDPYRARTVCRMTEHHTLTANGVRLAYEAAGPEDGEPLVLLPALGENAGHWAPVRDELARERRVYALDLRGHGRSEWTARYSLELMRDDVLAFLDALGLDRVDLAGHSMGGVVAYLAAQEQPHRVVRLVLEDVPAPFPREAVRPVRPDGELDFDWAMVLAVRAQLDRPDPAWPTLLGRITAPTLVVAGGPTSHVPQEGIAELVRRLPRRPDGDDPGRPPGPRRGAAGVHRNRVGLPRRPGRRRARPPLAGRGRHHADRSRPVERPRLPGRAADGGRHGR